MNPLGRETSPCFKINLPKDTSIKKSFSHLLRVLDIRKASKRSKIGKGTPSWSSFEFLPRSPEIVILELFTHTINGLVKKLKNFPSFIVQEPLPVQIAFHSRLTIDLISKLSGKMKMNIYTFHSKGEYIHHAALNNAKPPQSDLEQDCSEFFNVIYTNDLNSDSYEERLQDSGNLILIQDFSDGLDSKPFKTSTFHKYKFLVAKLRVPNLYLYDFYSTIQDLENRKFTINPDTIYCINDSTYFFHVQKTSEE